jgi:hypothetical protein
MTHVTPRHRHALAVLAVATLVAAGPALARAAEALPAGKVPEGMLLAGDFVEKGYLSPGVSKAQALVDLVNVTDVAIDVVFGEGTATLEPRGHLLVRADAGDVALRASIPGHPEQDLEGRLQVERGLRYAITLGFVPAAEARPAEPSLEADHGATAPAAPAPGAAPGAPPPPQARQATKATPASEGKGRKWVDVGRKRARDRQ